MYRLLFILFTILSSIATAQNVMRMATASGTNTYAATFNPPLTSLNSATLYVVTFTNANTSTTVTLDPAGAVAATAIKDNAGNNPVIGAISAGATYTLRYNGTNFRIEGLVGAIETITSNNDLNLDVSADTKINGVSGNSGEFIGNVDGHLVWAVPPGAGGSSSSAVLDVETTQVGNVGSGEDVLYTYTLPADTLNTNGEFIRGRISGIVANNANVKSIKLKFGGTTFMTRGTTTPTIGQGYTIDWEVIRTGATTQKCNATFSGSDGTASSYYSAAGETLSGTVVIQLTGEATSTDDIIKHSSVITFGISGGGGGGGDLSLSDFVTSETPTGSVNSINVTYTLANTPAGFIHVYLDGLLQVEGGGNDYTISGTTITMTSAPLTGSKIRVSYLK